MTVKEALQKVVFEAPAGKGLNDYAKSYALRALRDKMEGEALERNILYVLSNLGSWRGEVAREVKQVLKSYKP